MTLSPLVVLILLLFLMVIALMFLIWSFLTMPSAASPVKAKPENRKVETEQPNPQDVSRRFDYPRRSQDEPETSKNVLKKRLSNNQTRGLNAGQKAPVAPMPMAKPVEAVVTKKHEPELSEEMKRRQELERAALAPRQPRTPSVSERKIKREELEPKPTPLTPVKRFDVIAGEKSLPSVPNSEPEDLPGVKERVARDSLREQAAKQEAADILPDQPKQMPLDESPVPKKTTKVYNY